MGPKPGLHINHEICARPNEIKIPILVKKSQVVFHADRGDNAIDRLSDGFSLFPAIPVELSSTDVGLDAFRSIDRKFEETVFCGLKVPVVFYPLQDFREDYPGYGDILFIIY